MAKDFDDRATRRRRDKKIAEEFKEKGNEALKRGLYKSAKHHYSKGLETKKDLLPLYTNRALACLKLEEMQQVIDDTTRVLEYCEVFDDGYEKQSSLCYKALMRRGMALKW
jgi:tetratricopeptide (TPR) repeat protein